MQGLQDKIHAFLKAKEVAQNLLNKSFVPEPGSVAAPFTNLVLPKRKSYEICLSIACEKPTQSWALVPVDDLVNKSPIQAHDVDQDFQIVQDVIPLQIQKPYSPVAALPISRVPPKAPIKRRDGKVLFDPNHRHSSRLSCKNEELVMDERMGIGKPKGKSENRNRPGLVHI